MSASFWFSGSLGFRLLINCQVVFLPINDNKGETVKIAALESWFAHSVLRLLDSEQRLN